jgi:hypothetical protein
MTEQIDDRAILARVAQIIDLLRTCQRPRICRSKEFLYRNGRSLDWVVLDRHLRQLSPQSLTCARLKAL